MNNIPNVSLNKNPLEAHHTKTGLFKWFGKAQALALNNIHIKMMI